jgi:aminoglycoside phosphotransferase (APT) family kinase protein
MALSNQTDPQTAERQLTAWLATAFPHAENPRATEAVIPADAGLSTETILFDARWEADGVPQLRRLVARVQPAGEAVFPRYDLAAEARVLDAVAEHSAVPVPAVIAYEPDPDVLGAPFVVLERIDGRVPSDDPPFTAAGWVLELSNAQRATLHDNALRALAQIHGIDVDRADLHWLAERERADGEPGLERQLAMWRDVYEWAADGEENPTVEGAFAWIADNAPEDPEPLVLNWGDARPGNILFAEDDQRVTGVLDWEMVTLASPEMDLGWWLFLMRHHTEGIGARLPGGFPGRAETIARYAELTGHAAVNADFYEVFAGLRLSILMHRAGHLMIRSGLLPADAPMPRNNPASQLLARLAGLPAPDGAAQSFIGNR